MSSIDRHDPQPLPTSHPRSPAGSTRTNGGGQAADAAADLTVAHAIEDAETAERAQGLQCRRALATIIPAALAKSP